MQSVRKQNKFHLSPGDYYVLQALLRVEKVPLLLCKDSRWELLVLDSALNKVQHFAQTFDLQTHAHMHRLFQWFLFSSG